MDAPAWGLHIPRRQCLPSALVHSPQLLLWQCATKSRLSPCRDTGQALPIGSQPAAMWWAAQRASRPPPQRRLFGQHQLWLGTRTELQLGSKTSPPAAVGRIATVYIKHGCMPHRVWRSLMYRPTFSWEYASQSNSQLHCDWLFLLAKRPNCWGVEAAFSATTWQPH